MKSKSVLSVIAVFVALFSCSLIGYILGANATIEKNSSQQIVQETNQGRPAKADTLTASSDADDVPSREESASAPSSVQYILREADGKVALFIRNADGTEKLHSSYDVPIMFLPQSDRDALKKGIEFDSLDEIIKFAEDYLG